MTPEQAQAMHHRALVHLRGAYRAYLLHMTNAHTATTTGRAVQLTELARDERWECRNLAWIVSGRVTERPKYRRNPR